MHFFGMRMILMINILKILFLTTLIISFSQVPPKFDKDLKSSSVFILNPGEEIKYNHTDHFNQSLMGSKVPIVKYKKPKKDNGQSLLKKSDHYLQYKNSKILKKIDRFADRAFSFIYIKDTFDYSDDRDVFNRTFDKQYGMLVLTWEGSISRNVVELWWGATFGLGYNRGKGNFAQSGMESDTGFLLWTLPVDFFIRASTGGRIVKVSAFGGPSAMGLIQNREDFEDDHDKKYINQVGIGYVFGGKIQLSLSSIFSSRGISLFSDYSVSNLFWNFEVRGENYSNFQDSDIEVSGVSFGSGFTFEYF